ncbi:MAG: PAS domain S-box protein [Chloroflexi bacterium]|nr:PAS domain S-box protein [Chloroflexota bacterium]
MSETPKRSGRQKETSPERSAVAEEADFHTRLASILGKTVDDLGGRAGVVALWNETKSSFTETATCGLAVSEVDSQLRLLLGQAVPDRPDGAPGWDGLAADPCLLTTAAGEPRDPVVALPLRLSGKLMGVIYILVPYLPESLVRSDQRVLSAFADQVAISVQNARLASQLAEERRKFESILESSADGIMTIDAERRILAFNAGMERLTAWRKDEVVGRHCFEVLKLRDEQGEDICETDCPIVKGISGFTGLDGKLLTRDGQGVDVGMSYSIVRSTSGKVLTVVVNARDITRLRQVENLRSALLATVSHELQTPISIIKAYANTLARADAGWSRETMREKLHAIEEESDRLSGLVSKILYTSRLEK